MLTPTPHPEEPRGALNKVFLAREFNFGNGILLNARKANCGRDWDGVWSRFLSHEVTQGHAGPPWPHCPRAFSLPPTHPCAGTGCAGAPPPSLRPGIQVSASSSAVLRAPDYAVPTQATGAPARGHTTSLCLPGVHPDLVGRTVAHRHGHPLTWLVHLLSRAPWPPRWAHRSVSCLYRSHRNSTCSSAG